MANTPKHSLYNAATTIKAALAREKAITRLVQDMKRTADLAEKSVAGRQELDAVNAIWDFIENLEDLTTTFSRIAEGLRPSLEQFKRDFPGRQAALASALANQR